MITQMDEYIDIGVNLTGKAFQSDLDAVIDRALESGVVKMVVTGTDVEHSQAAKLLCEQYPGLLYATAGVHPHHADSYSLQVCEALRVLSQNDTVVAIGECGLDYNRNYSISTAQRSAFESQLELAVEVGLPVFLHQRDAHDDFVSMIKNINSQLSNSVAHCFTGSTEEVISYLELGMYIGVTGWICDERRGGDLQMAVKEIPLDRIMLETDAPYLLPRDLLKKPAQSRRNEPCYLPHICRVVANYMQVDEEELADAAMSNTRSFFDI